MEENIPSPLVSDGVLRAIKFSTSTFNEICSYSISDCPISHPSQLTNPFLGLPLESGKCEACGTTEVGKCEGHFGYIELPVPVYHPSHITELKHVLSLLCLKCMRLKKGKVKGNVGKEKISTTSCSVCRDLPPISIKEIKTSDGACRLELRLPSRTRMRDGFWNFLDKFGFHYGNGLFRPLLPVEALNILKQIPEETEKRLSAKGYFPQKGYILEYLPVPPNCLLVPEISDGKSIMSSDISISLLRGILNKIEVIKRSRSGSPNFDSHEVESMDLQLAIAKYMDLRGSTKKPHGITGKFAAGTEAAENSSKQWLEKMRTLFIRKGSGFSSRSVITGDSYIGINAIGLPSEIAKRVTFEERVTDHNIQYLQKMVDDGLCVTYKEGSSVYAIAVGSRGHTNLKVGQVINRSIVDGDIVFINRPPSTHKHSLQAFSVFIHDDHTVKINPLICAPLGADFDGDCVHIFYPQSLPAKAEVRELFSVEQQLLSSHSGLLNCQLVNDSLLSLKVMLKASFLRRERAQQLGLLVSPFFPPPAVFRASNSGPLWTIQQILQNALPPSVDLIGERHIINQSEILKFDFSADIMQTSLTEIITSILVAKGPKEALNFFNMLQPLLMEMLALEGFSINLKDFDAPEAAIKEVRKGMQEISYVLGQVRSTYNEFLELQVDSHLKRLKLPFASYIVHHSSLGYLIDSKSESAVNKVLQQVGFLGLQLFDRGKLYSSSLVQDIYSHYVEKYSVKVDPPSEAYGLVKTSFFHGLNPYEDLVHSISSREVIVRSSRGLTEPGTLFKNLMAILRDVVVCYDGTVRNVCTNSLMQFEYEMDSGVNSLSISPAGEPVGVLAATAISNPAYKAVLDSSNSTNSSWNLMKEILLCKAGYRNDGIDKRVILYFNDCSCGKDFCKENAALAVTNCLRKITVRDCATHFTVEYQRKITSANGSENSSSLLGHIHLDMTLLQRWKRSVDEILQKCQEVATGYRRKKGHLSNTFRRIVLSASECCSFQQCQLPCLSFSYCDGSTGGPGESLEQTMHVMANTICPILLDIIVRGDPRIDMANIVWVGPDATSWVRNSRRNLKGELAVEVSVQKVAARQNGDAWRTVLDACLPVIHLIDTSRSIPYGIQQIQELLGISCAFDQSVHRLSKAIKMVSKGLIREHLILVGSSMACTGNIIGFNTGGFKALFRSIKVQVPFTEATLYTPIKCFERAAEKMQSDSLASVVSSCSWGKNVALGTGGKFQLLWGQKHQVANNEEIGKDVYDLLTWVREPTERDYAGACLGTYTDDDFEDNENHVSPSSPELTVGSQKPTFEDHMETDCNKDGWEKVNPLVVQSDNWQGWDSGKKSASDWGSRETPAAETSNVSSWEKATPAVESSSMQGWGDQPAAGKSNVSSWDNTFSVVKPDSRQGWGSSAPSATGDSKKSTWEIASMPVVKPDNDKGWGSQDLPATGKSNTSTWEKASPQIAESSDGGGWVKRDRTTVDIPNDSMWIANKPEVKNTSGRNNSSSGWVDKEEKQGWEIQKSGHLAESSGWNSQRRSAKKPEADTSSGWNRLEKEENQGWTTEKPVAESSAWNSQGRPAKKPEGDAPSGWNQVEKEENQGWAIEKPEVPVAESSGWNSQGWSAKKPETSSPSCSKPKGKQGWKSEEGWGSQNFSDKRTQHNSPRPTGRPDDRKGPRRMDPYTAEEEKISFVVEPVMTSIRKILHETSGGGGGRLSSEDQKFIIENVFHYHPDKVGKVSGEIDYITVDNHATFQDSRCFYVVSSDGSRADFSYFKCMESFVNGNFPEHAESFNKKYFKRRQRPEPVTLTEQQS